MSVMSDQKRDVALRVSYLLGNAKDELIDALVAAESEGLPTRALWVVGRKLEDLQESFKARAQR